MQSHPLVSVGMPVYNRPEGLRRSLQCLVGQTYRNIEIIVSDNCSPDDGVKRVVEEFMMQDERISYYRQDVSLGVDGNFKFVLATAKGEFFMWAADDDEWSAGFIEQCLRLLQRDGVVSVMTHFETSYRFEGRREVGVLPALSIENSKGINACMFLDCVTPSLFYGIHKRDRLDFFLQEDFFEFYDCYFILRLILTGRVGVVEPCLYTAGVDAPTYQVKAVRKHRFTKLKYSPFFFRSSQIIFSSTLRFTEKIRVVVKLTRVVISMFLFHEIKRVFK
ncbi:glycosyltransferase family 2 protein [Mariprofundus ferrooxydans]|uniref:glycosyltransferase family 2 protein n=1 Tax=Mariprofundus ferrooxydans TaxID=314344 RepID=UPI0014308EC0|nr:glycosyltransferase family 2 protein [Mariprofundus ferrooxydans]